MTDNDQIGPHEIAVEISAECPNFSWKGSAIGEGPGPRAVPHDGGDQAAHQARRPGPARAGAALGVPLPDGGRGREPPELRQGPCPPPVYLPDALLLRVHRRPPQRDLPLA